MKKVYKLRFLILLILLAIGGGYFWKIKKAERQTETQEILTHSEKETQSSSPDAKPETMDENDDDGSGEEVPGSVSESQWTLLKTALPTRYFEPAPKIAKPSVVIILTDLGLNKNWTEQLLKTLNKKIILAFSPYSPSVSEWLDRAIKLGFQTLITMPMEPYEYPNFDPGPLTLLTGAKATQNMKRIKSILEIIPKATGILGDYGSRFCASKEELEPLLAEIKVQGHIFIDPNTTLHSEVKGLCKSLEIPNYQIDLTLPYWLTRWEENEFVKKVVQNAKENASIIIAIPAIPAYISRLQEWIEIFDKNGISIAQITGSTMPEVFVNNSGTHQGNSNVTQQDSHQPG